MTESPFEAELQRMFRQAPPLDDAEAFALRVRRRLERGWALRRGLIGVAGAAGGLVATAQFVGSNLLGRVDAVSDTTALRVHEAAEHLAGRLSGSLAASGSTFGGGEAVWMVAGLAGVGLALIAARVLEAF